MALPLPPTNLPQVGSGHYAANLPPKPNFNDSLIKFEFVDGWLFKTKYIMSANENFVRMERKGFGVKDIVEIPTHRITGIEYGYRSKPILLLIAVGVFLWDLFYLYDALQTPAFAYEATESYMPGFYLYLVICIILVIFYFVTRKQLISISSEDRNRPLWFYVEGTNPQILLNFIQNLETKYTNIRVKELK